MDKEEGLQRDVKFGRVGHQQETQLVEEILLMDQQPKVAFAA